MTLLQAVESGIIPQPPLGIWNTWQIWRRDEGGRPAFPPSTERELTNWVSQREGRLRIQLMEHCYGADWRAQLAALTGAAAAPEQQAPEAETAGTAEEAFARAERLPTTETTTNTGAIVPALRPPARDGPSIVPLTPDASAAGAQEGSEDGRSWTSSMVAIATTIRSNEELIQIVQGPFDPEIETLDMFEKRMMLNLSILEHRKVPIPWPGVDRNCLRARYQEELRDMPAAGKAAHLRRSLAALLEGPSDDRQAEAKADVLLDLMRSHSDSNDPGGLVSLMLSRSRSRSNASGGRRSPHVDDTPPREAAGASARPAACGSPAGLPLTHVPPAAAGAVDLDDDDASPHRRLDDQFDGGSQAGESHRSDVLQDALRDQTAAMQAQTHALTDLVRETLARGQAPRSAMKVTPTVRWPIIDDTTTDPEDWKREFERVVGLCNDCKGLPASELLIAQGNSCNEPSFDKLF